MARLTCIALLLAFAPGVSAADPDPASTPDPPPAVRAWHAELARADRLEHASLSFTLGLGVGILSRRPAAAVSGAFALGLAKEVRDRRHGGFDAVDLAAGLLGAGLAALATGALTR